MKDIQEFRQSCAADRIVKPADEIVAGLGQLHAHPVPVECFLSFAGFEKAIDRRKHHRDVPAARQQQVDFLKRGFPALRFVFVAGSLYQSAFAALEIRLVFADEGLDFVECDRAPAIELRVLGLGLGPTTDFFRESAPAEWTFRGGHARLILWTNSEFPICIPPRAIACSYCTRSG